MKESKAQATFIKQDESYKEVMYDRCKELVNSVVYSEVTGKFGKIVGVIKEDGEIYLRCKYE